MEWDLENGKKLIEVRSEMVTTRCGAIYGPGGKTAIMGGGYEHNLEHYDLATGKLLKEWCTVYEAKHMALSPDEKYVTVGLEDRAREWSLENYTVLHDYKHCPGEAARIFWIVYLPSTNEVLCAGRNGSIYRWSRETGKMVFSWTPHQSVVAPLCVSPDQKWALSYGTGQVAETNIATGEPRLKWDRHIGAVQAVAFLPSGTQAVSGSTDATLRVWDTATGKTVQVIQGANLGAYAVAVSPGSQRVAAGCKDGKVREFSLADGKILREMVGHLGFIRSVAYTPDGKRLLSSADDGSIRVWESEQTEPISILQGHRGGVLSIALSPDGKLLLSGGRDGTVRLWDLAAARPLSVCNGSRGYVTCVAFTPDGAYGLSSGRDGRLRKWDLKSGKAVMETPSRGWANALACAPDGKRAYLACSADIYCWDLETGEQKGSFKGSQGVVQCLAVSPDGCRLVSGSQNTSLLVWELK
jgi:WD40 repeat protein